MDKDMCKRFKNVRDKFPDKLNKGNYQFNDNKFFKNYCTNECNSNLDKISAGCLYFFDTFFKDGHAFEMVAKRNINIVEYILIWLIYMLNLIKTEENDSITIFYNTYIKDGGKYTTNLNYIRSYNSYKDLIDRSYNFLSKDMSIISKLYDVFNTLCDIYNDLDTNYSNCAKCSEKARQFIEKYKEFNIDYKTAEDNPYFNVLINFLIGYDNLKDKCSDFPSIPGMPNKNYDQRSEVASSSSSIVSKLIPILSILVAIAIFLGISYKYSLFGFRKRVQKQYLREKIKNIKNRMNR
ncbi:PIR protein [Plasmodium yoelii]|uniref:PIR protein n=2 Tax=Plasmodium yoelii TaxID=5861 RepID=A0AAE9WQ71_PLAYO|nr:PIR protein [Plasmodium yoelii]WBY54623.1 PIR protein [Plasmodium yoelii yoelii]CDS44276.1 YIR protein [Plasmodium yoelii]VTZ71617.1 PIR protein [Plasmodium yoelii]|eukprot:XP_022811305.1 PIR protein [Plasmodium yoelii]